MNLKYKVIFLLLVLSLINVKGVSAFFLTTDHSNKIRIDHTLIDQSTQDNNRLQIYDNFFSDNADSILVKKIEGFISADQIEINIPLKILARDSIYPKNSIDRMLLASLRVKKLISEYMGLQEKVRLLVLGNTVARIRKTNDTEKGYINNIKSEKDNIHEQLLTINRRINLTQDDVLTNNTLYIENRSDLKDKTILLVEAGPDNTGASAKNENNSYLTTADVNTKGPRHTVNEDSQLPWGLNFFWEIFNYLLNNRIEIILYMIFIAAIGFFISVKVKR